ncbi:MAG: hypothetical protein U0271_37750 [Polyangiaceae bacterium]
MEVVWYATHGARKPEFEFLRFAEDEELEGVVVLVGADTSVSRRSYEAIDQVAVGVWSQVRRALPEWVGQRTQLGELWFLGKGLARPPATLFSTLTGPSPRDISVKAAAFVLPPGALPRLRAINAVERSLLDRASPRGDRVHWLLADGRLES